MSTIADIIAKYVSKIDHIKKDKLEKYTIAKDRLNDKPLDFYEIHGKCFMKYYGIYRLSPPSFKQITPNLRNAPEVTTDLTQLFKDNLLAISGDNRNTILISFSLIKLIFKYSSKRKEHESTHAAKLLKIMQKIKMESKNEIDSSEDENDSSEDESTKSVPDETKDDETKDDEKEVVIRFSLCLNPFKSIKKLSIPTAKLPKIKSDFKLIYLDENNGERAKYYRRQFLYESSANVRNKAFAVEKLQRAVVALNKDSNNDTYLFNSWNEAITTIGMDAGFDEADAKDTAVEIILFINDNFLIEKETNNAYEPKHIYQNKCTLVAYGLLRSKPHYSKYEDIASDYNEYPLGIKITNRSVENEIEFGKECNSCKFNYHIRYFPQLSHEINGINIIISQRYAGSMHDCIQSLNGITKVEDSMRLRTMLSSIWFTKNCLSKLHIRMNHKKVNLDNKPRNYFFENSENGINAYIQTYGTKIKNYCVTVVNPVVGDLEDIRSISNDGTVSEQHGTDGIRYDTYTTLTKYSSKPLGVTYLQYLTKYDSNVQDIIHKLEKEKNFEKRVRLLENISNIKAYKNVCEILAALIHGNNKRRINDSEILDHKFFY
eukprot:385002_1